MSVEQDYYKVVLGTDDRYRTTPARGIENGEWVEIHNNCNIPLSVKKYLKKEDLKSEMIGTTKLEATQLRSQQLDRNRCLVETQLKNGKSFLESKTRELKEIGDRERALCALIDGLKDWGNT